MFRLTCKVQNYAWGIPADQSLVAKIAGKQHDQQQPYAEYWMGDHLNGTSEVMIDQTNKTHLELLSHDFCTKNDKKSIAISELISINPVQFLGQNYHSNYPEAKDNLAFLFKVLSVSKALSI